MEISIIKIVSFIHGALKCEQIMEITTAVGLVQKQPNWRITYLPYNSFDYKDTLYLKLQ